MKKSTILFLVVVYVVAFFIVGFLGIQLRSHYQVNYVNEIKVVPFEESGLVERSPVQTETFGTNDDPEHLRIVHEYNYKVKHTEGLILKFNIQVIPDNTTYREFKLSYPENSKCVFTKNEDSTLFISDIVKYVSFKTEIQFTVEDNHMNGVKSTVKIIVS